MNLINNKFNLIILLILLNLVDLISSKLHKLNDENWWELLNKEDGEWMIEFYAPWCPACRNLQPVWEEFASWSIDLNINVGQVDITNSPGLSGRFMITALPTIYHIKNNEYRQYKLPRTKESLMEFIEDKKYLQLEPINAWYKPTSFIMNALGEFYRCSMVVRHFTTELQTTYNLPNYTIYILFGLLTIGIGLILGLILVCFIDCVYPMKKAKPANISLVSDDNNEEIVNDDDVIADSNSDDISESDGEASKQDEDEEDEEEANTYKAAQEEEEPKKQEQTGNEVKLTKRRKQNKN